MCVSNCDVFLCLPAGLGEFRIRDLNDEINKLLREKRHWEERILELGGPDHNVRPVCSVHVLHNYRTFAKKGPLQNIGPPPILGSISCQGLKFTLICAHMYPPWNTHARSLLSGRG